MNNLTQLFEKLTPEEQNNLMKGYLSDKLASLIHTTLNDSYSYQQAQSGIESIINCEITNNLSNKAKNHILTMCDKALEIVHVKF